MKSKVKFRTMAEIYRASAIRNDDPNASTVAEENLGKGLPSSNSHASPASKQIKGTTSQMDGQGLAVSSEVPIKKMPISDHHNHSGSKSSCMLFSENVNIEVPTLVPDISQRIEMLKENAAWSTKVQKVNDLGCEGDNISCISKADGTNLEIRGHNVGTEQKNVTGSSASVTSFCKEGREKAIDVQSINHASMSSECIAEVNNKFRGYPEFAREALQSAADISDRSDPSETSSLRDDHGAISPKVESVSPARGTDLLTSQKNSHPCTDLWKGDAEIDSNGMSVAINKLDQEQHSEMRMAHNIQEHPLQSRAVGDNEGSDELVDVRVCDICGDVGREAQLAVCSKCGDGAEHIYCMRVKMDNVPEGDWMCEDCMVMVEAPMQKDEGHKISRVLQKSSTNELAKTSRKLDVNGDNGRVKMGHASLASPRKRLGLNIEVNPSAKRRALDNDTKLRSPSGSFAKAISPRHANLKSVTKGEVASPSGRNPLKNFVRKAHETFPGRSSKIESQLGKGPLIKQKSSNSIDLRTARESDDVYREQKTVKGSAVFGSGQRPALTKLMKSKSFSTSSVTRIDRNDSKKNMDSDFKIPKVGSKRTMTQRSYSFNSKSSQAVSLDVNSSISIVKPAKVAPVPVEVKQRVVQKDSQHVAKIAEVRTDSERATNTIHHRVAKRQCDTNGSGFDRKIPGSPADKGRSPGISGRTNAAFLGQKADRKAANAEKEHKLKKLKHQVNDNDKVQLDSSPSGATVVLAASAHPEVDFVWRGMLNLECNKLPICCSGLQAHLSNLASPKAREVVSKLPCEMTVKEVLQQDIWPVQFTENRVTEENIALYFFAEDYESYRRYKRFLNCMMVNDLALMANLDGVQLLIFHSQALPARSRRWNNLFFLWGVFRAKKSNFPNNVCLPSPREGIRFPMPEIVTSPHKSKPINSNISTQIVQGLSATEAVSGAVLGSGSSSQTKIQSSVSAKFEIEEGISINEVNGNTMENALVKEEQTSRELQAINDDEVDGKMMESAVVEKEQTSGELQAKNDDDDGKTMDSALVEKDQTSKELQATNDDDEVDGKTMDSALVEKDRTSKELQPTNDDDIADGKTMESAVVEKGQTSGELQPTNVNEFDDKKMENALIEKEQHCAELQATNENEVDEKAMKLDPIEKEQHPTELQDINNDEVDGKTLEHDLIEKDQHSPKLQPTNDNEVDGKTMESTLVEKERDSGELQSVKEQQRENTSPDQAPVVKRVDENSLHVLGAEISAQATIEIESVKDASIVTGGKHQIAIDVNIPAHSDGLEEYNDMNGHTISLNSSPSNSGNTGTSEKAPDHHRHHSFNLELPLLSENELAKDEDMDMLFGQANGNVDQAIIEDDGFVSLDLSLALPSLNPLPAPMMEELLPDMNDDVDTSLSLSFGGKKV